MTNGEKLISVFPYIKVRGQDEIFTAIQIDTTGTGTPIAIYTAWWNAEYQEPRKGHWIDTNNIDAKYKAIYMCSNCRSYYTEMKPINMNFCPNCGADMRGNTE